MAVENLGKCISYDAGSDLSASQYCCVVINSNRQLALPAAGVQPDGILQDDPDAAGRTGAVMVGIGESKIKTGGSFSVGDLLMTDSSGRAVLATSSAAVIGKAMSASTGANQVATILFRPEAAGL